MKLMLCAAFVIAVGCGSKKDNPPAPGSASAAVASKPGEPRKIAIEAGANGFAPDTIKGAPGEKLVLVFTRTVDGECMSQVKFEGQKPIELPKDQAVDVPVTVPTSGKLQFACAMDMNTGVIVPSS
ncbi:MAG TPA: hypothetical protein VL463_16665 [Kofleriaceae bacterium]|jgi:plastocyanin domain-containing protein|nr:hypothetical protein [Kofleriaceae bacterium]